MYSFLSGILIAHEGGYYTINTGNIGFDVFISPSLQRYHIGDTIEVWVHHHITEVSQILFGFSTTKERSLFRTLLKVNGIWWKTAIAILGLWEEAIYRAIEWEDDILLSSVPWIGKKTAQKMIVELKWSIDFTKVSQKSGNIEPNDIQLITSLVQMWYDKNTLESIIWDLPKNLTLEEKTREAIKRISQK